VPQGYIEIRLSTKGLLGCAPAVFHIRNFNTEDLMNLGIADQEDLPRRLTAMLDAIILEHDPADSKSVSVRKFHEKEITELMLKLYEAFYGDVFPNQVWKPTEEDWAFLAEQCGGKDTADFRARERALKNGDWKPIFDIPLKVVKYFDVTPPLKHTARIKVDNPTDPSDYFEVVYDLPRFGDVLALQDFVNAKYAEEDKRFAAIGDILQRRQDAEQKLLAGENINMRAIPDCPASQKKEYKEYAARKSALAMQAMRALHMKEATGRFRDAEGKEFILKNEDVSKWSIDKRIILATHPNLNNQVFTEIKKEFDKLEFGIKPKIHVTDPILSKEVDLPYSFQLNDIMEAMRDKRPTNLTISIE
jgi:hypothetical protein